MLTFTRQAIILLVTVFLIHVAWGQRAEFSVTHYDETTGMQSNVINAMMQDSRGYLWFGTADGLFRYDGYTFKMYRKIIGESNSLPGSDVVKLAEDHDGKIWIGFSKDGISCYDPATGTFKNFPVNNIDSAAPLARAVTMLFIDGENNVWAGLFQKGLVKLNQSTGRYLQFNVIADTNSFYSKEFKEVYNVVNAMHEEGNGIYWLATRDGLYRFNGNTAGMDPVRARPLQKNVIRDDLFTAMAADRDGLWLASWAGGLSYFNCTTQQWSNYKFDSRKTNVATINIVHDVKPKNGNELWIASPDKGFGSFNKATRKFTFFSNDPAPNAHLPGKFCYGIMQDKQNNIWLSHAGGLSKVKQQEKKFLYIPVKVSRSDNGPFYEISSMLEDKGGSSFFTGTSFADGLHITNRRTGKTQVISFPVKSNEESILFVNDLLQDTRGTIWVLTRDYIYQYDPVNAKLILVPQPPGYVDGIRSSNYTVIKEDRKGKIWIASGRNGVFCYDQENKTYKHFYNGPGSSTSLPSNVINGLAVDKAGRIWVGGRGCLGYFDDSLHNFNNIDQYGTRSKYNFPNRVYTLHTDRNGDIWAGTDAGLFYYLADKTATTLKRSYNVDNGMRGDIVYKIQQDQKGDLWCITNSALCKINTINGNVATFGRLDGIENVNSLHNLFLFADHKMALLSNGGYYVFDPNSFTSKNSYIPIAVTSFKIDDKEEFFENKIIKHQKVIVPADVNVISFEYAAIDFDRPDKQQYAYMLEGFDKSWVMAGSRRYAGYANIPGGDYTFKVKATNTPDNWEVPVVAIPLHINEPFYKSWWFILAVFIMVAGSFYTFYRFKLDKQQQILKLETKAQILQKEKALVMYETLKQQLNPHFLFNSLTSLSSLIRYDQNKAADFLDGLSKIYRYILKSRHNETVTLAEEIKSVQTFIKLQKTRFEDGFVVNINIDEKFDRCKIPPVTLQNLVENAIKHNIIDKDSPLVIDIYTEGDYIIIRNTLQRKNHVETSNKQGLLSLATLYEYLSNKPVVISENEQYFFVKIPVIYIPSEIPNL